MRTVTAATRLAATWSLTLVALLVAPWGCEGDSEETTTGGENRPPCDREEDCDDGSPCTFDYCPDGRCLFRPIVDGPNPEAEQTDGDCMVIQCDQGESSVQIDPGDPPADPNEGDCMVSRCDAAGTPVMEPAQRDRDCDGGLCFCNGGVCDDAGNCGCAAANPSDDHFVDPVDGQDIPTNGGAFGSCAYRSLSYALSQATGTIRLRQADYSAANGETLPFVLTGQQRLRCFDFSTDGAARLLGAGMHTAGSVTNTATVVMTGNSNDMRDCVIDGTGGDHCVWIVADGTAGHGVRVTSLTGCTNGISVTEAGDGFEVSESSISGTTVGIRVEGDRQGNIAANMFSGNGTDIQCTTSSPELEGTGNGGPSCNGCANCGSF